MDKTNLLESFRSSIEDLIPICEKLGPHCNTIEELTSLLKHALENDAQLKILLKEVTTQAKK